MTSLLLLAAFALLTPLGSTDPLANVNTASHHQERKDPIISVIVVVDRIHPSGSFRDRARVEAYGGSRVAAVQFTKLEDVGNAAHVQGRPPFNADHPKGVDERVRIIHFSASRRKNRRTPNENQVSHLKASCEDRSESTIVVVTDEICIAKDFWSEPCGSNDVYVFRNYPSSLPSPEKAPRYAYIPLGPRDTFPFIERSRQKQLLAALRPVLFNVQVTAHTSPRRDAIIEITEIYAAGHPEQQVHLSGRNLVPYQWVNLLQRSKFTICPGGHNPETYRMFEALETGSIPIVSKEDYLDPAFCAPHVCGEGPAAWNTVSASPFAQAVSVDSWEDLPQLLERLARMDDNTVNRLQEDCEQWYAALMRGKYSSLLSPGNSSKFWPQNEPIVPSSLDKR